MRELVVGHAELTVAQPHRARAARQEGRHEIGVRLAKDERALRLHDARLLLGDLAARRPEVLHVVDAHVGHDGDTSVDDVRRVPTPADTDLDDRGLDGDVGEPPQRNRGDDLEVAGNRRKVRLDLGDQADELGEVIVGDRLAVPRDALIDPLEVRRRVRAGLEPGGDEQRRRDARRRRLAVRARQMDRRILELRRSEQRRERLHPLQRRMRRTARLPHGHADRLQVHVGVEPGEGLSGVQPALSDGLANSTSTENSSAVSTSSASACEDSRTSSIAPWSSASRSAVSCTTTRDLSPQ